MMASGVHRKKTKRLAERSSGVAEKLTGNDVVGSRRSSLGDSPKGSRSSLGTRREIIGRRPEDSPQECQRLPDWRDGGCTATAQAFGKLMATEPPVPRNLGTFGD
ncbi:hypothetical protein BHE74_00056208 [Ensete ventricosum]|nr:hypothetical protein BHE74_00056208 [Ensete ventricosum]